MVTTRIEFEIFYELLNIAKQTVKDVGGCDHSVGICICELYRTIEDAEKIIAVNKKFKVIACKVVRK